MKARIVFIDNTEIVADNVDAKRLKERFETANCTDLPFAVSDNLIVQCSYVRCITFFE